MSTQLIVVIVIVGFMLGAAGLPGLTLLLWGVALYDYRRRKQNESEEA